MSGRETQLQRMLLAAVPYKLPWLRLYRRMVGQAEVRGAQVRFGVKGQCDLYGFTRGGRHVEIELKSVSGRMSPEQCAWRDSLVGWNVAWFCLSARVGETDEEVVARWLAELSALKE